MAAILGRRRSRNKVESPPVSRRLEADADEEHRLRSLFQQHFETKFEPLKTPSPNSLKPCSDPSSPLDTQDEQDWNGLSDNAEGPTVQVVEQSIITGEVDLTDKGELKSFMTAKPPLYRSPPPATIQPKSLSTSDREEVVAEAENLKKDLALQRLLRESHLLDSETTSVPSGRNRHKAVDLRLQSLGSKSSTLKQQKMPLAHRKGIVAKAADREDRRRREAKENGVILEKAVTSKKTRVKRQRGVDAPSVGKFRGGMLKLSKKDVADIQGPKKMSVGKIRRR